MSRPTLEGKIGKTLRKANRLKATHAKLERVDELLDQLRSALTPLSALPNGTLTERQQHEKHRLEGYVELCILHKLTFQIDAVLTHVQSAMHRLSHEPHLQTHDYIESLVYRLRTVLALNTDHPEARELLHQVMVTYPQYLQDIAEEGRYISLAPHQAPDMRIAIACHKADIEKHAPLQAKYSLYHIPDATHAKGGAEECRLRFSLKDLDDFELFHEELRTRAGYRIRINGRPIQEQHFTDWFHCYMRFRKANSPNYCYGASPFTYNVFGCHKLYTPDIAKRLDLCWFSQGALDPASGFFFLKSTQLLQHLNHQLEYCGFCPAMTQEKLSIGLNVLPYALNPECDDRWQYWPPHRPVENVIPTGHAIAIALADVDFAHVDPSQLIEMAPTPYIEKLLRYLETGDRNRLSAQSYRGLSTCIQCGVPYKPNTMICGKCHVDFWKYALQDLDRVLDRLRSTTPILLPSPSHETPAGDRSLPHSTVPPRHSAEERISFDQLWNDPQVQQMLTTETPHESPAVVDTHPAARATADSQPKTSPETVSQYRESLRAIAEKKALAAEAPATHAPLKRLHFHEKIRSLVSKKYRERKAIETAFSPPSPGNMPPSPGETPALSEPENPSAGKSPSPPTSAQQLRQGEARIPRPAVPVYSSEDADGEPIPENAALLHAIKNLKPRQKSELSKRGVVRVVYLATMDKDTCPLCAYLDGMVMDPDDPATDIFSPPLYPGCTCRREYVLKTEKPQNWPRVTFKFPPKDLLDYLNK